MIERGRQVIRDGVAGDDLDVPLGPEIGQCCGGRVNVAMRIVSTRARAADLLRGVLCSNCEEDAQPSVLVFGAGHMGQALARSLALLPLKVTIVDTRADELAGLPPGVMAEVTAMPEAIVRGAPEGSAYLI